MCYEKDEQIKAYSEHYQSILKTRALDEKYTHYQKQVNRDFAKYRKLSSKKIEKRFTINELKKCINKIKKQQDVRK